MAKPMYITLDALIPDRQGQESILVKRVSEEYKGRTFAELLEKMVDGSADELNEHPYNAQENEVASYVRTLLASANVNPVAVQLFALSNDEPPQEIHVSLNAKISDYNDRILKSESVVGPSNEEQRYQKIELTISDHTPGGYI
jgi:hypothetical protein